MIHAISGVTSYRYPLCLVRLNIFKKIITNKLSTRNTQVTPEIKTEKNGLK